MKKIKFFFRTFFKTAQKFFNEKILFFFQSANTTISTKTKFFFEKLKFFLHEKINFFFTKTKVFFSQNVLFKKIKSFISKKIFFQKAKFFFTEKIKPFAKKSFYFLKAKYNHEILGKRVLFFYLVRELLLYFSISFLFFFSIFFVNQILLVAERILRQGAPFFSVARLMVYSFPFLIAQSAPFATLVGFLMCLGRFMSDNELIVIRASGFGYIHILFPVVLLGLAISLVSFFVNDYLLPLGTIKYNSLYREIISANPAIALESNSVKHFNDASLIAGDVTEEYVSDLVLIDDGDETLRFIFAGKSKIEKQKIPGVMMKISMDDAHILLLDKKEKENYDSVFAKKTSLAIFESSLFFFDDAINPAQMTAFDLGKEVRRMEKNDSIDKYVLNIYKLEYNKKFSLPFGSLFFAFFAFPLALLFGTKNGQTSGMIIGMITSFFYWAMMILGQYAASRNGFNGFLSMWIPNLVIAIFAGIFYFALKRK